MDMISFRDRERLRSLAYKQGEYANSEKNEAIMKKWKDLAGRRKGVPTVRLLFSNF